MAFEIIVETMADMGVFQLFFPWLLVLATSYGVLDQSEVISDDEMVNGLTALSIAFFAIGGAWLFYPAGLLTHLAAVFTFGIFGIIGLVVLMGVAGFDLEQLKEDKSGFPLIVAILVFIIGFLGVIVTQLDLSFLAPADGGSPFEEVVMPILVLIFLALVILGVTGSEES